MLLGTPLDMRAAREAFSFLIRFLTSVEFDVALLSIVAFLFSSNRLYLVESIDNLDSFEGPAVPLPWEETRAWLRLRLREGVMLRLREIWGIRLWDADALERDTDLDFFDLDFDFLRIDFPLFIIY